MKTGIELIAEERRRQIKEEDWPTEQDEYFGFYEKVKIEIDGL